MDEQHTSGVLLKRWGNGIFPFYLGNIPLLLLTNLHRFYHNDPKYWDR